MRRRPATGVLAETQVRLLGLDPSAKAVAAANAQGVNAQQGTAENLPFESAAFDIVVFGFCLYLCDRRICSGSPAEQTRGLRNPGWIVIQDFYSPAPECSARTTIARGSTG